MVAGGLTVTGFGCGGLTFVLLPTGLRVVVVVLTHRPYLPDAA